MHHAHKKVFFIVPLISIILAFCIIGIIPNNVNAIVPNFNLFVGQDNKVDNGGCSGVAMSYFDATHVVAFGWIAGNKAIKGGIVDSANGEQITWGAQMEFQSTNYFYEYQLVRMSSTKMLAIAFLDADPDKINIRVLTWTSANSTFWLGKLVQIPIAFNPYSASQDRLTSCFISTDEDYIYAGVFYSDWQSGGSTNLKSWVLKMGESASYVTVGAEKEIITAGAKGQFYSVGCDSSTSEYYTAFIAVSTGWGYSIKLNVTSQLFDIKYSGSLGMTLNNIHVTYVTAYHNAGVENETKYFISGINSADGHLTTITVLCQTFPNQVFSIATYDSGKAGTTGTYYNDMVTFSFKYYDLVEMRWWVIWFYEHTGTGWRYLYFKYTDDNDAGHYGEARNPGIANPDFNYRPGKKSVTSYSWLLVDNDGVNGYVGMLFSFRDFDTDLNVNFTGSPLTGTSPYNVQFNYTGDEPFGSESYYWQFGDGGTSTEIDPLHEYIIGGYHWVNLTVTDEGDNIYYENKTDYVYVSTTNWAHVQTISLQIVNGTGGNWTEIQTMSVNIHPVLSSGFITGEFVNGLVWLLVIFILPIVLGVKIGKLGWVLGMLLSVTVFGVLQDGFIFVTIMGYIGIGIIWLRGG